MKTDQTTESTTIHWGVHFGIWTALGLFWATRLYASYNYGDHVVPFLQTALWGLADFYVWGALSPLVIYLARRWPLEKNRWFSSLPLHLVFSVILAPIQLAVFSQLFIWVGGLNYIMQSYDNPSYWIVLQSMTEGKVHSSILIYWGILFVYSMARYYRQYRSEQLRASDMETRLAQAELAALRMQLQPHFLFNTLNTIASLMRENIDQAETMIARLGDLLRASLERDTAQVGPLADEIQFLKKYLDIEAVRYQDRLTVRYQIDDDALEALTPNLILQPLVENAVKHGIAPKERDGLIEVSASAQNGYVTITVRDNGPGLPENWREIADSRVGLTNCEARLEQLYHQDHEFVVCANPDAESGTLIRIRIPFSKAENAKEISEK
jgi:signal transduction histidine kinase